MQRKTLVTAALAGALAFPAAAAAHITATPDTAAAGGYATFTLRVGHGCEGSPTTKIVVQMPDQVLSATPQIVPGWDATTKIGKLAESYDSHGETISEGVRQVTWTGGPLPDDRYTEFGLSVRFGGEAGEAVPFKTIQQCEQGRTAWIQVPEEGQAEPEHPAPMVTLEAAEEDGHGAAAATDDAETEPVANVAAPEADSDDDSGPSTGLVVAALVLGGLGTLLGAGALLRRPGRTA